jgi:hypothetical protein
MSKLITKNDLKAIFDEILPSDQVDYVVEQGTSGGWNWTKWNGGKFECWYHGNAGAYTCGTSRGNGWYSGANLTFTYPYSFVSMPALNASVSLDTNAYVVYFQLTGATLTKCIGRITANASIAQNSNYLISVHAVGTWE